MAAYPSSKLKPSDRNQLIVHQALHGYSGGHRLLESSCSFSAAAERQIDVLSDLSGSTPPSGFEEYLTIYPVAGMQVMALAKTWLAKEMPRPGCVWTHTLLLDFSTVRSAGQLASFTQYFVRPTKKKAYDVYANPLSGPSLAAQRDFLANSGESPSFAHALVQSWYTAGERKPLVISAESSRTFECVLLSLWEQQIPSSRTCVSISTGSISDRKIGGRSFDIQVVPRQNAREVLRQCRGVNLEEVGRLPLDAGNSWSPAGGEILSRDLNHPSQELRDYLRTITDPEVRPADIPIFAEAFSVWFGPSPLAERITRIWSLIGTTFPQRDQAASLKAAFFGNSTGLLEGEGERLMLQTLLLPEKTTAFLDFSTLRVTERCAALAAADTSAATLLLEAVSRSHRPSEIAIQCFNALLDAAPERVLLGFLEHNRPLLRDILARRPELIRDPTLWALFDDNRHEVVAAVAASPKFSPLLAESLLSYLTRSEGSHLAETFVARCSEANLAIFLPIALKSQDVPVEIFERFLRRRMETVYAVCATQPVLPGAFLLAASRVISPSWGGNSQFPFSAWAASLRKGHDLHHEDKIRMCAFSVAMALSWRAPETIDFLRYCFLPVYLEAKADRIGYQSWALVEPLVPSLWGWGNWDKCEKMRRAILEKITQGIWPPAILLLIASDVETLSAFIKTAGEQGYQRIFPALLHSMDQAASAMSAEDRSAIQRELSI